MCFKGSRVYEKDFKTVFIYKAFLIYRTKTPNHSVIFWKYTKKPNRIAVLIYRMPIPGWGWGGGVHFRRVHIQWTLKPDGFQILSRRKFPLSGDRKYVIYISGVRHGYFWEHHRGWWGWGGMCPIFHPWIRIWQQQHAKLHFLKPKFPRDLVQGSRFL